MKQIVQRSNFRVYLNKNQISLFERTAGCARFIWNRRVESFNSPEKSKDLSIKELKVLHPFLEEVPYNALEQVLQDWNQTKKQFFNKDRKIKLGRPKFKSKRERNQSFRVSYNGFSLKKGFLSISKFGKLRVKGLEEILTLSGVTSVTLTRKASGKFYVSIVHKSFKKEKVKTGKSIGIDLGLTHLIIDSQGKKIENPRFFRKSENKLKALQRALSKKKKGSRRKEKTRIKIASLHEKISNQRNNFLHKVSNDLINSYDFIYVETLSVKNMVKNRRLSKSISDASWAKFVSMLEYKADWYGKKVHKIHRFFASSKTCSECGFQKEKMDLSIREWTCPDCGSHHDRDVNAAKNVLQRGIFEELQMGSCKTYLKNQTWKGSEEKSLRSPVETFMIYINFNDLYKICYNLKRSPLMQYIRALPYIVILILFSVIGYREYVFYKQISSVQKELIETKKEILENNKVQAENTIALITRLNQSNNDKIGELNETISKINTTSHRNNDLITKLQTSTSETAANYHTFTETTKNNYTKALTELFNESTTLLGEIAGEADRSTEAAITYHSMLEDNYKIVNETYIQNQEKDIKSIKEGEAR